MDDPKKDAIAWWEAEAERFREAERDFNDWRFRMGLAMAIFTMGWCIGVVCLVSHILRR